MVNRLGLSSVKREAQSVELTYRQHDETSQLLPELERLVQAEQGCCGAAGVEFELIRRKRSASVVVKVVLEGLPSQTVIAAFAAMNAS